jgi:hypothetical protein
MTMLLLVAFLVVLVLTVAVAASYWIDKDA